MPTERKLEEADFFLCCLSTTQADATTFEYLLSAFLTSARSVVQYAAETAKHTPLGRGWYDTFVRAHPIVQFFKTKRDANIHVAPVETPLLVRCATPSERDRLIEAIQSSLFKVRKAQRATEMTDLIVRALPQSLSESQRRRVAADVISRLDDVADHPRDAQQPSATVEPAPIRLRQSYYFADWPGSEDVVELGRRYLDDIRLLLAEGRRLGHLGA